MGVNRNLINLNGVLLHAATRCEGPSLQIVFITTRKRSLGQGNIFTPVCHSVHRGGGVPGRYTPPGQVHPPRQVHPPWTGTPPGQVYPPGQVHLPGRYTPLGRYTPSGRYTPPLDRYTPLGRYTPPGSYTPPGQVHPPPLDRYTPPGQVHPPPRYGQRAGGTHPTGMQSCFFYLIRSNSLFLAFLLVA